MFSVYLCNIKDANQFPESMLHDIFRLLDSILTWLHNQRPREFTCVSMDMFARDLY